MILSAQLRVQQVRAVMREHSGLRPLKDKVVAQFVFNLSPESSPECSGTVTLPCAICGIQTYFFINKRIEGQLGSIQRGNDG